MKNFLTNSLAIFIFILYPLDIFSENLCYDMKPYMVDFFKGVGNEMRYANINREAIESIYGYSYEGLSVRYELFYNQTEGYFWDLLDVFAQKY